jgi:regulator of protease activity HflC (stomatin/prohibitin superfamily)
MLEQLWDWLCNLPAALFKWLVEYAQKHPVAAFLVVLAIVRSFGVTVRSGRAGVLFFCGRVRKVLEPGFHPLVPILHRVKETPIRSVTLDLPRQRVSTVDGLVYDVDASIIYRVEDPVKALTTVDDVGRGVTNLVPLVVAEVMCVQTVASLSARLALDADLMTRTQKALARWGLVVEQAGLNSIAPTRPTARLTQLGARVRERVQLLRKQVAAGTPPRLAVALVAAGPPPRARSRVRYHSRRGPAPRPALPVQPAPARQ